MRGKKDIGHTTLYPFPEDGGNEVRQSSFSLLDRDQYTGFPALFVYFCLTVTSHMRTSWNFIENYITESGREPCLFLLTLLGEVCRQKEHTLPLLCLRRWKGYECKWRHSTNEIIVQSSTENGMLSLLLFQL